MPAASHYLSLLEHRPSAYNSLCGCMHVPSCYTSPDTQIVHTICFCTCPGVSSHIKATLNMSLRCLYSGLLSREKGICGATDAGPAV
jgi:hypothetical protein